MPIEIGRAGKTAGVLAALLLISGGALAAEATETASADTTKPTVAEKTPESESTDWQAWAAGTSVSNTASLQRGARNFVAYCLGCHSLRFIRWSRIGEDLHIPLAELQQDLIPPGDKPSDYILTSMPAKDAEVWFGKQPPDLSLMARERGVSHLFQFLKTFYVDPTKPTGANNLFLPNAAMPDVVSALEGLKKPVYKSVPGKSEQEFDHFEQITPGSMSAAEYDAFVRDTVNFLDYVGEPTQLQRHSMGLWVVLFLLVFTWLAWLMKQEYWKDVH